MVKHIADTVKVVVFDHDDTLVGTIGAKWAQHKYIAKRYYKKELTDEEIKQHWGKPLNELISLLYETKDIDAALAFTKNHHQEFPKELFTATIATLKHLKEAGLMIGIVTATSGFSFEHDLDYHQVPRELVDYTQTADDTDAHKPSPAVFDPLKKWLAEKGIANDEVLYIGDGLHDMQAAVGAGFNFLGVETGLVTAEEFSNHNAKSIASIADLLEN